MRTDRKHKSIIRWPVSINASRETADTGFMNSERTGSRKSRGLTRRRMMTLGALGLTGWVLSPIRTAAAVLQNDLERVAHIPQMAKREGPLMVFRDFADDPDVEVKRHIRLQLSQQKVLLTQLREKIGLKKEVRLSVEDVQVRLMFVPQLQKTHAAAYYRYCLDIIDHLFAMNQMETIYETVSSPARSYPPISETGLSAFLVHRLAKDYRAVCRFTAENGRNVAYRVTGAIFSNHLGAVDLEIEWLAPGSYGLGRKPFTVWQNDTRNLYTLMSVPVEETLHYCVGRATDREIARSMANDPPENLTAAQRLAEEWMAVEESVVGGLVNRVLADYCRRHHMAMPFSATGDRRPVVPSLPQYRYRTRGIQLASDLGFKDAMALYMDSPSDFKAQLFRPQDA